MPQTSRKQAGKQAATLLNSTLCALPMGRESVSPFSHPPAQPLPVEQAHIDPLSTALGPASQEESESHPKGRQTTDQETKKTSKETESHIDNLTRTYVPT